jgi:hypothetical protein
MEPLIPVDVMEPLIPVDVWDACVSDAAPVDLIATGGDGDVVVGVWSTADGPVFRAVVLSLNDE